MIKLCEDENTGNINDEAWLIVTRSVSMSMSVKIKLFDISLSTKKRVWNHYVKVDGYHTGVGGLHTFF